MPRNGAGTYSLPAGNPVVAGDTIEASWANTTLSDVANELTNSLDRSGNGGMLAPFRLANGSLGAPGIAWLNEPSTGFYRSGAGEQWAVVTGVGVMQFTAGGALVPAGKTLTMNGDISFTTPAASRQSLKAVGYTSTTGSAQLPTGTTAERDGSPVVGSVRFNSTIGTFEGYNGTAWDGLGNSSINEQEFSGNSILTAFTLSAAPTSLAALEVFISGVRQKPTDDYTVSGTTLTFTAAPPTGTDNIFCRWITSIMAGAPADGTVIDAKVAANAAIQSNKLSFLPAGTGAVATTVQSKLRESVSVLDFGAVGNGVTNDTDAFVAASAYITAQNGGRLVVPAGTYKVGKQVFAGAIGQGYAYLGVDLITIDNCTSPVVIEFQGVTLMYEAGLKYGSFDPITGAVYTPGSLPFTNYDYQASIGCAMRLQYNNEIAVVGNVVINGRNDTAVLGGQWGDTGYQCVAYALYMYQNNRTYVQNLYAKYMHGDGIALRFPGAAEGGPGTMALLENITSEYSGRQGFSWTGGIGLTVINMKTNYNGRSTFFSAPASGIDIEAEDGIVRKGKFINCESIDNRGNALVADSGDSADVEFENCFFLGTSSYTIWPKKPNFTFRNCKIYGSVVNTIGSVDPRVRTKFYDCYFSDEVMNGLTPYIAGGLLFGTINASPVLFSRCSVKTTKSAIGRLDKAIIEDCYFNMQAGTSYIANQGVEAYLNNAVLIDNTFESNITVNPPADAYSIQMTQTERCYGDNNLINTAGVVRWHNWSAAGGGITGLLGGLGRNGDLPQSQYRVSLNNNQFPWSYYGTTDIYAGISAPASGTYKRGDRVLNNTPAVGSPKAWVCTVAGTPGTWVSEGNL